MTQHHSIALRPLTDADVPEYTRMLYASFNAWYWKHGLGRDFFGCAPEDLAVIYDVYNDLTPGCCVAAFDANTGQIAGACFYSPRDTHVGLGIMCVHPNCGGRGIGRALVDHILQYTREHGYRACRLVGSAINMDSFSLYNRLGFVPRAAFQDLVLTVPETGLAGSIPGEDRVRPAALGDVPAMGALELEISGIKREIDYRYAIENPRKLFQACVYANHRGGIEGFLLSIKHTATSMIGPCVARTEEAALALIKHASPRYRGAAVLLVVPMDKRKIVEQLYAWRAVNVETHLAQIWGEFQPFRGVCLPSFLPESG
jgi:GNAT superfamily N-acetyltransferase